MLSSCRGRVRIAAMSINQPFRGLMVLWGVPGTGKSYFAHWLVTDKGYVHSETDAGLQLALNLASRSLQHGRPVVIEWGVYVDQNAINTRVRGADGDPGLASTVRICGRQPAVGPR
jgi:hypothetical protein